MVNYSHLQVEKRWLQKKSAVHLVHVCSGNFGKVPHLLGLTSYGYVYTSPDDLAACCHNQKLVSLYTIETPHEKNMPWTLRIQSY